MEGHGIGIRICRLLNYSLYGGSAARDLLEAVVYSCYHTCVKMGQMITTRNG